MERKKGKETDTENKRLQAWLPGIDVPPPFLQRSILYNDRKLLALLKIFYYSFIWDKDYLTIPSIEKMFSYAVGTSTIRRTLEKMMHFELIRLVSSSSGKNRRMRIYKITEKGENFWEEIEDKILKNETFK